MPDLEIRPILSTMRRNPVGAILIALQVAFTLGVVANSLFIINDRIGLINRPTGFDIDNIVTVQSTLLDDPADKLQQVRTDIEALEAIPGVIAATSVTQLPLSNSGSGTELFASADPNAPEVNGARFTMTETGLDAMGLTLAEGRWFREDEIKLPSTYGDPINVVIVTRVMADALFPDGNALGATVYDHLRRPVTLIGIVEHMQGSWISWQHLDNNIFTPQVPMQRFARYVIRTEPGSLDQVMSQVEPTLAATEPRRIVQRLRPYSEIRDRTYTEHRAMAIMLGVVSVLLIIVTAVGIVGLVSFVVRQRTRQIGTRRAIGAQRLHIVRYFLVENWLMTTGGAIVGMALAFGVNYWLANLFSLPRLDPWYLPAGLVILWLVGLLSVFAPARRAARISPAIATRGAAL